MFLSNAAQYQRNMAEALSYKAGPALLTSPEGDKEPAVILTSVGHIKAVLPVSEALRLANQIADAVEAHR